MKKRLLLILLALSIVAVRINAQTPQQNPRWSIGLATGLAFPTGSFAHFHNSVGVGDVQPGIFAELSGNYRFTRFLSANLVLGGQLNHGDGIPYGSQFYRGVVPPSPAKMDDDHSWQLGRVLAGATYTRPLQKNGKISGFVRGLAGIQKTRAADYIARIYITGVMPGPPGPLIISQPAVTFPWALSWQADAGFQWKLHRRWALSGFLGFNGCSPSKTFTYVLNFTTQGTVGDTHQVKASFPTPNLHAGVGLTYYFPY